MNPVRPSRACRPVRPSRPSLSPAKLATGLAAITILCLGATTSQSQAAVPHQRTGLTLRPLLAAVPIPIAPAAPSASASASASAAPAHGALAYSDEFSGPAGAPPNPSVWNPLTGGSGWGNNELETYTSRASNVSLDGQGHLALTARRETYRGSDGITRNYTSGRVLSSISFQYGYLEARIKVPVGQGLWPAFWTVGADIFKLGWPACGEIDILEGINGMQSAHGTVHGPSAASATGNYGHGASSGGAISDGAFHTYAIDWRPGVITWYLDGSKYFQFARSDLKPGETWAFDKPQLVQFNLAVGGNWPGSPNATTPLPATMLVDYVRLYRNS